MDKTMCKASACLVIASMMFSGCAEETVAERQMENPFAICSFNMRTDCGGKVPSDHFPIAAIVTL